MHVTFITAREIISFSYCGIMSLNMVLSGNKIMKCVFIFVTLYSDPTVDMVKVDERRYSGQLSIYTVNVMVRLTTDTILTVFFYKSVYVQILIDIVG